MLDWTAIPAAIAQLIEEADYRRVSGESTFRLDRLTVAPDRHNPGTLRVDLLNADGKRFVYSAYVTGSDIVIDG